jgi:hypothetical protein
MQKRLNFLPSLPMPHPLDEDLLYGGMGFCDLLCNCILTLPSMEICPHDADPQFTEGSSCACLEHVGADTT